MISFSTVSRSIPTRPASHRCATPLRRLPTRRANACRRKQLVARPLSLEFISAWRGATTPCQSTTLRFDRPFSECEVVSFEEEGTVQRIVLILCQLCWFLFNI